MARPSPSPETAQLAAEPSRPAAQPVPRPLLVGLTLGVGGTVLFLVIYLVEGAIRPGYNALQQTISALSFGPLGWIQRADFILCGLSVLGLALLWRLILQGGMVARWYPIAHGIEGLGLVGVGIFVEDPVHTAFLILIVYAMSVSLFVIAWRFWHLPGWHGWALFSAACGLWPNVLMPFFGVALISHSAFSSYAGLIERLATSPDIVWGAAVLIPLWAGMGLMRPTAENSHPEPLEEERDGAPFSTTPEEAPDSAAMPS